MRAFIRAPRRVGPAPVGMTLIELIIVMAIVAVLAAVAIPRFAGAIQNSILENAAKRVACDLRVAQANAIKTQSQQTVTIDLSGNSYQLTGMAHPDHPSQAYIIYLNQPPYQGVKFSSVNFGTDGTLIFDRFGGATPPGTVVLDQSGRKRTVRVAAGAGRITIE